MSSSTGGGAGNGAPTELDDEATLAAEDARAEAVLRDFSAYGGPRGATVGARLYDIVRDADGPITCAEIVERWYAAANYAALGHVRRYAAEMRRRDRRDQIPCEDSSSHGITDARAALSATLRGMLKRGAIRRLDGSKTSAGMWNALVVPGRAPRVYIAEGRTGPYDEAERSRRAAEAEKDRARALASGVARPLARSDVAKLHRLAAFVHRELAEIDEAASGLDARVAGNFVGNAMRRYAPERSRAQLEALLDEVERAFAARHPHS